MGIWSILVYERSVHFNTKNSMKLEKENLTLFLEFPFNFRIIGKTDERYCLNIKMNVLI